MTELVWKNRRVDELGRVVLPPDARKALGLQPGDSVEVFLDQEKRQIILCKASPAPLRAM